MSDTAGNPPTSKQRRTLAFFGMTARSAAEAHRLIAERLADPVDGKRYLLERARLLLEGCPDLRRSPADPQDSHAELFRAAAALVHGFALEEHEAWPLLRAYADRSDLPWSDHEVQYKLRSAARASHKEPRGHLVGDQSPAPSAAAAPARREAAPAPAPKPRPAKVTYDPEKLRTIAAKWRDVVDLPWLADRSAVDPSQVTTEQFLRTLYPTEKIICFDIFKSQGQALWPTGAAGAEEQALRKQFPALASQPPVTGRDGVWFLPQPVNGLILPNPRTGKMSRRSEESVVEFRYLLLESDDAEPRDWLGFLVRLPLRIEAIYTSAGRSVHGLVRVNCASKSQFDAFKARLEPTLNLLRMGGVDDAVWTGVRLSRLPGAWREGKSDDQGVYHRFPAPRLQKLLYLRPNAPVRAICEMPAVRDVVSTWCGLAAAGPADSDDTGEGIRQVRQALEYYGPASRPCRLALHLFNLACTEAGFDCDTPKR